MKIPAMLQPRRPRFLIAGATLLLIAVVWLTAANHACQQAAAGRIYRSAADIPARAVGLVLGTGKETRHGRTNLHFTQRIEAAAALYRAGKVRHLLVSGDHHAADYDEPDDMRHALIAAGVPARAITCDYAGFRTLDSMVRAKEVFGLSQCTVISEEFHCPRALWIARQHGLDAIAFAAPDVSLKAWSWRAKFREQLARSWCAVDLYLFHRGPKFLGPKEPLLLSVIKNGPSSPAASCIEAMQTFGVAQVAKPADGRPSFGTQVSKPACPGQPAVRCFQSTPPTHC